MEEAATEPCRSSHKSYFAFRHNSDTEGEENQSCQPRMGEKKRKKALAALIIVTDLSRLQKPLHVSPVYQIRSAFALNCRAWRKY